MPRLMEKRDWSRTVAGFGSSDRVWQEDLVGDTNRITLSLPEEGMYRVFFVKVDEAPKPRRRSARELIGCLRKYGGKPRTAEDWLHEIREGDEDQGER